MTAYRTRLSELLELARWGDWDDKAELGRFLQDHAAALLVLLDACTELRHSGTPANDKVSAAMEALNAAAERE